MTVQVCAAQSNQGTVCKRELGHIGCHEGKRNDDNARWWGDARWAPWEWIAYEYELDTARSG